MSFVGVLVGAAIGTIIAGGVIWIVSMLDLGLKVASLAWAMLTGALIGSFTTMILQLMVDLSAAAGAVISVALATGVILLGDKLLGSLQLTRWTGALVAAVAITAANLGFSRLLALLG